MAVVYAASIAVAVLGLAAVATAVGTAQERLRRMLAESAQRQAAGRW